MKKTIQRVIRTKHSGFKQGSQVSVRPTTYRKILDIPGKVGFYWKVLDLSDLFQQIPVIPGYLLDFPEHGWKLSSYEATGRPDPGCGYGFWSLGRICVGAILVPVNYRRWKP